MMGSGKTEIGRILSSRIGLDCIDLDEYIQASAHMAVVDIFKVFGEAHFRDLEERALEQLALNGQEFVLCCGGGVVLSEKNRAVLKDRFLSVWLDVPLVELERRLANHRVGRPLLMAENWMERLKLLYTQRRLLYKNSATIRYCWQKEEGIAESAIEIERLIHAQVVRGAPGE